MKSIREKAEEFAKENINSLGYIAQEHVDGYVAGANYVLEEIEKVIRSNSTCEKAIFKLGKLVIQLKK